MPSTGGQGLWHPHHPGRRATGLLQLGLCVPRPRSQGTNQTGCVSGRLHSCAARCAHHRQQPAGCGAQWQGRSGDRSKTERIGKKAYCARPQATAGMLEYIECLCNPTRLHSTPGLLRPGDFKRGAGVVCARLSWCLSNRQPARSTSSHSVLILLFALAAFVTAVGRHRGLAVRNPVWISCAC